MFFVCSFSLIVGTHSQNLYYVRLGSWKPQFLVKWCEMNNCLLMYIFINVYFCTYINKPLFLYYYLYVLALNINHVFYWLQNASHWSKVMASRRQRIKYVCSQHRDSLRRFLNHNRLLFDTRNHLAYCRNAKVLQQSFLSRFQVETICR